MASSEHQINLCHHVLHFVGSRLSKMEIEIVMVVQKLCPQNGDNCFSREKTITRGDKTGGVVTVDVKL